MTQVGSHSRNDIEWIRPAWDDPGYPHETGFQSCTCGWWVEIDPKDAQERGHMRLSSVYWDGKERAMADEIGRLMWIDHVKSSNG